MPTIAQRRREEVEQNGSSIPFFFGELQQQAEQELSDEAFLFASSAAGNGLTKRYNRTGFERWRIVPRVFRDTTQRDLSVEIFGKEIDAPIMLAPIGNQTAFNEEGELASARAASSLNIPFTLSTASDYSIEDVAGEISEASRFFQLYWTEDWETMMNLIERAERADYDAIQLTVDTQAERWIPETIGATGVGKRGQSFANLSRESPQEEQLHIDYSISWEDFAVLRDETDLPILIKGIVHPQDAIRAIQNGADGIVVSNHGGRQIDGTISTIQALPEIVEVVGDKTTILFDGGLRGGADAFIALALGADIVALGRPYVYGLAINGEQGVYEVIHNLMAELDSIIGQAGFRSVDSIDTSALKNAF
jgi:isopentenyl diphosphate isomerase/L-lactate dehydrogenase-like FMN-dependent dehydrogenase